MYIGSILPWSEFHQPDVTGITYPRLFALGFLVMALRRIPSILLMYKLMPKVCKNWKEALFMGYFGPIGEANPFIIIVSCTSDASSRYRCCLLPGACPSSLPGTR